MHGAIQKPDRARVQGIFFGRRQMHVAVAVDIFAMRTGDQVIDIIDIVGAQEIAGWIGQARHYLAVDFADLLRQYRDAIVQRLVEGLVGDRLRDNIGNRDADRP